MKMHLMPADYLTTITINVIDSDLGLYQDANNGDRITLLADGEHVAVCPQ